MGKGEVHLIWIRGYEDVWGCVEGGGLKFWMCGF